MKTIKVAKPFQELFGQETTRLELYLSLLSAAFISALLLTVTFSEWRGLALWRQLLLVLLAVDLTGGIVANFSFSTNQYYSNHPKARISFILINIQPLALALLLNTDYTISIIETIYTLTIAFVINAFIKHPAQRVIGATLVALGITVLLLFPTGAPVLLLALMALHIFKIGFSFAVDHFAIRKDKEILKAENCRHILKIEKTF